MKKEEDYIDEDELEVLDRLSDLGICEDYSDIVNNDLLEELAGLTILTNKQRDDLLQELENIRTGMSCYQPEANTAIRNLINRYDKYIENNHD